MPRLRPDLDSLRPYRPGRSAADVAAEYGVSDVVKLASNEMPEPPWPEVVAAVAAASAEVNRYPDNARTLLRAALGDHLGGVDPDRIWAGGASNELATLLAIAFGGPGTSILYAWPSFSLYPIAARTAGSEAIEVPLDEDDRHDLDAMTRNIRSDTTVVFVCNPNNPSGTHVAADRLRSFIDDLDPDVLVVVDEAYHEFATAPDHRSAVDLAATRPNVAVTRTFSKAFGLAGLRLGYMVAAPEVLDGLRRIQVPFTVTEPAMAGAVEALRHGDRVAERVAGIARERSRVTEALRARGVAVADSQANFVYADLGDRCDEIVEGLLQHGVIIRVVPPAGHVRISIGTNAEMDRFVEAFDAVAQPRT